MSLRKIAGVFFLVTAGCFHAAAEEGAAIRAKTVVHADGSYTETVTSEGEMVSRATTYDAAGKVIGKMLNRLNANMEPVASYNYDPGGKPLYWTKLKRHSNGRVVEAIAYTPQNKLIRRVVYSYDALGRLTGFKTFDSEGREMFSEKTR